MRRSRELWFGGKSRIAPEVWARFGDVPNFVEPFAGSLAVLLGRPTPPRIETVNDKDCFIGNLWRALQQEPEAVAHWADWPVNECDLSARHLWLVNQADFRERMKTEPDYCDAKIAGWWVWGISQWIGSGWCAGTGVHRQLPHLGNPGTGVHRKRPHLGGAGTGVHRKTTSDLYAYMAALAARLRYVRVCCGDWSRVLGPTPTEKLALTGIFLDPPYSNDERTDALYAEDHDIAGDVEAWAIEHGDNPQLRIALCGYAGEHEMPNTWTAVPWKAHGGYGSQGAGRGRENAAREMIWFSSACLQPDRAVQYALDWDEMID